MKVGIMQPYFFPYLGYWQLLSAVDKYVVYDDVAYIKGGWINRNNILLNGKSHLITLPLEQASSFKNINEIDITHNMKQREKVLKKGYSRQRFRRRANATGRVERHNAREALKLALRDHNSASPRDRR